MCVNMTAKEINDRIIDLIRQSFAGDDRAEVLRLSEQLQQQVSGLHQSYVETINEIVKTLFHFDQSLYRQFADKWHEIMGMCEQYERRCSILYPNSRNDFENSIRWFCECGIAEDLDVLDKVNQNAGIPFETEKLVRTAKNCICKRIFDPVQIANDGEAAYVENKTKWDKLYNGQYIAIFENKVVASNASEHELFREIGRMQRENGPFRAYIIFVKT